MSEIVWNPDCPMEIPATFVNTLTEQDRLYGRWTSNRSYWSFYTKNDIRGAFGHDSKGADDKRLHLPEAFTDVFEHLVTDINFMPSCFPITIVWSKHLQHFDSTREQQVFKEFVSLPTDLLNLSQVCSRSMSPVWNFS